jgi:hypothetical protein
MNDPVKAGSAVPVSVKICAAELLNQTLGQSTTYLSSKTPESPRNARDLLTLSVPQRKVPGQETLIDLRDLAI